MTARAVRFECPRPLSDWLENGRPVPGDEIGGLALSPMALACIAESRVSGLPCELAVTGEEWTADGRHFLVYGATRDHIEAVTDYRHRDGALHYVCPECDGKRGHHERGCPRRHDR